MRYQGEVLFTANDGQHGQELWITMDSVPRVAGDTNLDGEVDLVGHDRMRMVLQRHYLHPVSQLVPLKIQSDHCHVFPWWVR